MALGEVTTANILVDISHKRRKPDQDSTSILEIYDQDVDSSPATRYGRPATHGHHLDQLVPPPRARAPPLPATQPHAPSLTTIPPHPTSLRHPTPISSVSAMRTQAAYLVHHARRRR